MRVLAQIPDDIFIVSHLMTIPLSFLAQRIYFSGPLFPLFCVQWANGAANRRWRFPFLGFSARKPETPEIGRLLALPSSMGLLAGDRRSRNYDSDVGWFLFNAGQTENFKNQWISRKHFAIMRKSLWTLKPLKVLDLECLKSMMNTCPQHVTF